MGENNTGDWNTGDLNTGNRNTGNRNTGNRNTGNWNTGDLNTGDLNTGNRNTGNWNTGDLNTGNWNTGDLNTGNRNTGNWNTGDWNTGDLNTGDLNTNEPTMRLFNKDSNLMRNSDDACKMRSIIYRLQKPLCEWVSDIRMTDTEKEKYPTYKTTGGYLKVNSDMRNNTEISKEDSDFLKSLPNFDAKILLECTGIDLENQKVKIIIDGKEIMISKESAEELKRGLTC